MKCPVDDTVLAISERRGVEIDYCPQCRGVWLDRGELDKLIERAAEEVPDRDDDDDRRREQHREQQHQHREYRPSSSHDAGYRKRKKKSFLSEFFEFD